MENTSEVVQLTIEENFKKDIEYINSDIIARQRNGRLCKYSRILQSVIVYDLEIPQYLAYWTNRYRNKPEYLQEIKACCINKLKTGLLDRKEMISLVNKSNESKKEKIKVIELLGGKIIGY